MAKWWADGVRFGCVACGRCCVKRIPSASSLGETEIAQMAAAVGQTQARFRATHTEPLPGVDERVRLRADASGRCSLLTSEGQCSVFAARPAACRTYPFWPENLASQYEWAREADFCDGIRSPWARPSDCGTGERRASSGCDPGLMAERPLVSAAVLEKELLLEELRRQGVLETEDWTHEEASEHLEGVAAEDLEDIEVDETWPRREVVLHEDGVVVLDTVVADSEDADDVADGWRVRSVHFETSMSASQSEVLYHAETGAFLHKTLRFQVHQAFLDVLRKSAFGMQLSRGVAVLGGGGGVLPMALCAEALDGDSALSKLGPVTVVELDAKMCSVASDFFGFQESGTVCGPRLVMGDALNFMLRPAVEQFAAIFVDLAGSTPSSEGVLLPIPEALDAKFVRAATRSVRPSGGVVAWNVLLATSDQDKLLQDIVEKVSQAAGDFQVSVQGPLRSDARLMTTQWLLVASATQLQESWALSK